MFTPVAVIVATLLPAVVGILVASIVTVTRVLVEEVLVGLTLAHGHGTRELLAPQAVVRLKVSLPATFRVVVKVVCCATGWPTVKLVEAVFGVKLAVVQATTVAVTPTEKLGLATTRLPLRAGTVKKMVPFRTWPAVNPAGGASVTDSAGVVVQVVVPGVQFTVIETGVVPPLSRTTLPLLTAVALAVKLVVPVGSGWLSDSVIGCEAGTTLVVLQRLMLKVSLPGQLLSVRQAHQAAR